MTTRQLTMPTGRDDQAQVTTRVQSRGCERFNGYELQAIEDLIAWVAEEQDSAPITVRCVTTARFGVNDLAALPRQDYDNVIRFLVDLRIEELQP